ncbi:MAG: hypothetical protein IPI88_12005 [Chitinophagaceae bacterium]|nr:hypothetical protein [Chitinophagaceae bacterium]
MKHFGFILAFFLFLTDITSEAQTNNLIETKTNAEQKNYRKILILGKGALETRAFLEILSQKLISKFKTKGIEAKYYFKGKDTIQISEDLKQLATEKFDAVISFEPRDSSHYSHITYSKNNSPLTAPILGPGNFSSRSIEYQDIFEVSICEDLTKCEPIWGAILSIDSDFTKKDNMKEILNKIFFSFRSNKILK